METATGLSNSNNVTIFPPGPPDQLRPVGALGFKVADKPRAFNPSLSFSPATVTYSPPPH